MGEYVGEFVNIDRCITYLPTFSEGVMHGSFETMVPYCQSMDMFTLWFII